MNNWRNPISEYFEEQALKSIQARNEVRLLDEHAAALKAQHPTLSTQTKETTPMNASQLDAHARQVRANAAELKRHQKTWSDRLDLQAAKEARAAEEVHIAEDMAARVRAEHEAAGLLPMLYRQKSTTLSDDEKPPARPKTGKLLLISEVVGTPGAQKTQRAAQKELPLTPEFHGWGHTLKYTAPHPRDLLGRVFQALRPKAMDYHMNARAAKELDRTMKEALVQLPVGNQQQTMQRAADCFRRAMESVMLDEANVVALMKIDENGFEDFLERAIRSSLAKA